MKSKSENMILGHTYTHTNILIFRPRKMEGVVHSFKWRLVGYFSKKKKTTKSKEGKTLNKTH